MPPSPNVHKYAFPFSLLFVKNTDCGIQISGAGWAAAASIVLSSNLKVAILQFELWFVSAKLPEVVVKPVSFPPQAPHTA